MNSRTKKTRNPSIGSKGKAIMSKAKELRKKYPNKKWTELVSQASKELKNKK